MNGQMFDFENSFVQILHFFERNVGEGVILLFVLLAVITSRRSYIFKKGAVRIEAVFSGNEETINRDGGRMYRGLYEYIDPNNGSKRVLRTSISTTSRQGTDGEKRWILYNKDGPISAQFDSFLELWSFPVISVVFALVTIFYLYF